MALPVALRHLVPTKSSRSEAVRHGGHEFVLVEIQRIFVVEDIGIRGLLGWPVVIVVVIAAVAAFHRVGKVPEQPSRA
jgi:hypothetical protein